MIRILRMDKTGSIRKIPIIAIDIENNSDTGAFICASLYGYYNNSRTIQHIDEFFTNQTELCSRLKDLADKNGYRKSFILTGYNFGYDHIFLESILDDSEMCYSGSRFITSRIKTKKGRGIPLIDMFNHTHGGSLEEWIKYLDMETKYGITKISLTDLISRNKMDTKATYYLSVFIQDFYERLGVGLKLTVASNALALFKRKFLKYYFLQDNDFICSYERKAYYGGRTECFEVGVRNVKSYDINSTYLSVMCNELMPDPSTTKYYDSSNKWEDNFKKYDGIYHCKVFIPKQKICPLPYHSKDGKLIFPWGTFSGYWTKIELVESMKYGCKILDVYDYVIYRKSIPLFKEFAQYIWDERKYWKSIKNKGMDMMTKRIGNSLYGKFGERENDTAFSGKVEDFHGEIEGRIKVSMHDGVEYISIPANKKETRDTEHSFPIIAVYITSYARIKLLHEMKKHEKNMIYCDTDSIKYIDDGIFQEVSSELGFFGFEYEKEQIFFREKIKGVKKDALLYSDIDTHSSHAVFKKPNKFKESIRRGLIMNKWENTDKNLSYLPGDKRTWYGEISEPLEIDE